MFHEKRISFCQIEGAEESLRGQEESGGNQPESGGTGLFQRAGGENRAVLSKADRSIPSGLREEEEEAGDEVGGVMAEILDSYACLGITSK